MPRCTGVSAHVNCGFGEVGLKRNYASLQGILGDIAHQTGNIYHDPADSPPRMSWAADTSSSKASR
jgi:hypothetical protein